jgi:hypothetical protein
MGCHHWGGVILGLMLSGCATPPVSAQATPYGGEVSVLADGMEDVFNQYPSTVKVSARVLVPGKGRRKQPIREGKPRLIERRAREAPP